MRNRCEVPVFYFDAAIGVVTTGDWTTRMFGPNVAVNLF